MSKTKIEPGKLAIKNVYCNDKRDKSDIFKEERQLELEEMRKSFAEKRDSNIWENKVETLSVKQVEVRPRSKSEFRSKMSDDSWMKENSVCTSKEDTTFFLEIFHVTETSVQRQTSAQNTKKHHCADD